MSYRISPWPESGRAARAYDAAGARALDQAAQAAGVPDFELMLRAGRAAFACAVERFEPTALWVVAGKGNNGGDAYVVAGLAARSGLPVRLWQVLGSAAELRGEAAQARDWAEARGVVPETAEFPGGPAPAGVLIVDGLLGTGLQAAVRPAAAHVIDRINGSSAPVLALDVPSGLSADTGAVLGTAVRASTTVTFIAMKLGLLTGDGPDVSGALALADLGVSARTLAAVPGVTVYAEAAPLPPRARSAFKNQFGHVVVVGGDHGGGGAVAMAAEAALRTGAGLVSVATRTDHVAPLLSRRPELMVRGVEGYADCVEVLGRATCVVVGPGLGTDGWGEQLLRAALEADLPTVADADALNLLAANPALSTGVRPRRWVLTPHPGEAARLLGAGGTATIAADRVAAVRELARRYDAIAVLKGAGSLVADATGLQGVCALGNPGMATAGMGDVLSGVVAGCISTLDCDAPAVLRAVALHAAAGDRAAQRLGEASMLATDVIAELPEVLRVEV